MDYDLPPLVNEEDTLDGLDRWIYDHVHEALTYFDDPSHRLVFHSYEYVCYGDGELLFVIVRRSAGEGEMDAVLFFTFANLYGRVLEGEHEEWEPTEPFDTFFTQCREKWERDGYEFVSAHLLTESSSGKWSGSAMDITLSIGTVSLVPPPGIEHFHDLG